MVTVFLRRPVDDAQSFLGYILSAKLSFRILFSTITCILCCIRDYDEQKAVVVVSIITRISN